MNHKTAANEIITSLFEAREAKTKAGGVFTVKQAIAHVESELDRLDPAPIPKLRQPSRAKMTDEGFVVWLKTDPAYKGVNVDAEIIFARAWAKSHARVVSRRYLEKWMTKAARDLMDKAAVPVTSSTASAPWRAERTGWRELMVGYPVRNPKSANYRDRWEDISDDGKQFIWSRP